MKAKTMQFPQHATLHTPQEPLPLQLHIARSLWRRWRGLMLTAPLLTQPVAQGLLIPHCPSVHGFFMRYPLDIIYLSRDDPHHYTVTHTDTLAPWHISLGRSTLLPTSQGTALRRSAHTLELPAGVIEKHQIAIGQQLEIHAP